MERIVDVKQIACGGVLIGESVTDCSRREPIKQESNGIPVGLMGKRQSVDSPPGNC
jgi:hypothetical protein